MCLFHWMWEPEQKFRQQQDPGKFDKAAPNEQAKRMQSFKAKWPVSQICLLIILIKNNSDNENILSARSSSLQTQCSVWCFGNTPLNITVKALLAV